MMIMGRVGGWRYDLIVLKLATHTRERTMARARDYWGGGWIEIKLSVYQRNGGVIMRRGVVDSVQALKTPHFSFVISI